jgi:signal peptidase I
MPYDPTGPDALSGQRIPDNGEGVLDTERGELRSDVGVPSAEAATPAVELQPTEPIDVFRPQVDMPAPVLPVEAPAPSGGYYAFEDADVADRYADVPVSLELAYTTADLGLSADAFDRAIPYEGMARRGRSTGARVRQVGRELAETVILAVLIFFAVKAVVQNFRVEGASMEPSLQTEQYLLVNKALYFRVDMDKVHQFLPFIPGDNGVKRHLFRAPRRGDVVVFRFPLDPSRDFIKRVIGVPGDTVEVKDEKVFINGSQLVENYILATPNYTYGPKTVPPGTYFVLGDNRRNSYDSHAWGNTCPAQQQCDFVPEENIIGQAWFSYWPFDSLGFVNNKKINPQAP